MNRAELKSRIRDGINDPSEAIFTDAQLNDLIDEAAEFIVAETSSIKRSVFVPLREGVTYYSLRGLAPDMMLPYGISDHTRSQKLPVTSMEELDAYMQRWIDSEGPPERWFSVAWDIVGVWPKASSSGGVLRIDYYAWPRPMLDDGDQLEAVLSTHDAIVQYAVYMGLLKQWDGVRAVDAWKTFRGNATLAKARSGVLRVGHKSFVRNEVKFPHTIRSEE